MRRSCEGGEKNNKMRKKVKKEKNGIKRKTV
jgi:hypothetical protein